jgi:hypothetical protein
MLAVLIMLCVFAAIGVVAPLNEIGKTPKTLTADVAAFAAAVMVAALAAMFFVAVHLDGSGAVAVAEGLVSGSWLARLFQIALRTGKVPRHPVTAKSATFNMARNLAVLATLLYLLTQAV